MSDVRIDTVDSGSAGETWDGGDVADYFALLKPRVMSLVIFTALVGMAIAPGGQHPVLAGVALLCIAVGAGASGALNMWYDADIDAVMTRTARRPIPAGRVDGGEALAFGIIMAAFSVLVLGVAVNWLAAALLAFTIVFYAVIYTMWLKRWTAQNIVIGGLAGALPPLIGWASVTGSLALEPFILVLIIFFWTPPHFWALALYKKTDYTQAGIPMMPNVAGDRSTRRQIFGYAVIVGLVATVPWLLGHATLVYGAVSLALGAQFIRLAWHVVARGDDAGDRAAKRLFGFSIFYLFALFATRLAEAAFIAIAGL
jgi:protoheme IX farnesyltransferase